MTTPDAQARGGGGGLVASAIASLVGATSTATATSSSAQVSLPPSPPPPPELLLPSVLFERAVLPFVQKVHLGRGGDGDRFPSFSLLEVGSWSGLYSLELAKHFPRATLVAVEPDRVLWRQHVALARSQRRSNLVFAQNEVGEDVAEALAHSNEFLDGQLLLSLHTVKPFDHGVYVTSDKLERLDKFIGHLLSLARRSLLLLPSAPTRPECRDNRLVHWAHNSAVLDKGEQQRPKSGGGGGGGSSGGGGGEDGIAKRLQRAGRALGLRIHAERTLAPQLMSDGCEYELWEVELLHMDRVNRHHFCLGGCKTHTRRTYRMVYTGADPGAADYSRQLAAYGDGFMNMTNEQTGRHIPFETGSMNMHSLLSLQGNEDQGAAAPAAAAMRQALIIMFLSLPIYQDPAPWNVVWRAGELFPIDVGDGTTYEGKWDTFAQKYIGSLNECYRMSLKWLCANVGSEFQHGDERTNECMRFHFRSVCPASAPYPCFDGCNTSYQGCAHLKPPKVTPGYLTATNPHVKAHKEVYKQFFSKDVGGDEGDIGDAATVNETVSKRYGSADILSRQMKRAATRRTDAAKMPSASAAAKTEKSAGKSKSNAPISSNVKGKANTDSKIGKDGRLSKDPQDSEGDAQTAASTGIGGGGSAVASSHEHKHGLHSDTTPAASPRVSPRDTASATGSSSDSDATTGLQQLLALRRQPEVEEPSSRALSMDDAGNTIDRSQGLSVDALGSPRTAPPDEVSGHAHFFSLLTILQMAMVGWVGMLLFNRSGLRGQRLFRAISSGLSRTAERQPPLPAPRGVASGTYLPRRNVTPSMTQRAPGMDSRLLGEL